MIQIQKPTRPFFWVNLFTFRQGLLAFFWVLPLAVWSASPKGGTLFGTITVTAAPRKTQPLPASSSPFASDDEYGQDMDSEPVTNAHVLPEEIVVFLKKVPGDFPPPTEHAVLDQKYLQFTHRVLPILKGTTVDFTNDDNIYHNVFSNSISNPKFDLGRRVKGEKVSVKLDHPEDVRVYCEIHSSMKAHILVLQNPYFTSLGPGDKYTLTNVPPGDYQLVVWHDYWAPVVRDVTVKKGKSSKVDVTLNLVRY
jgi:plastocyanin